MNPPPSRAFRPIKPANDQDWRARGSHPLTVTMPTWKTGPIEVQKHTFLEAKDRMKLHTNIPTRTILNPNARPFIPRMNPAFNQLDPGRNTVRRRNPPPGFEPRNLHVQAPPPPPSQKKWINNFEEKNDPQAIRRRVTFGSALIEKSPPQRPFMLPPCSSVCLQNQQEGKLDVAKKKNLEMAEKIINIEKEHNVAMNLFKQRVDTESKRKIDVIYQRTDDTVAGLENKIQQLHMFMSDLKGEREALIERCDSIKRSNIRYMNVYAEISDKAKEQAINLNALRKTQTDLILELNCRKNALITRENDLNIMENKNKELLAEKKDVEFRLNRLIWQNSKDKGEKQTKIEELKKELETMQEKEKQTRTDYENNLKEMAKKEKELKEESEALKEKLETIQQVVTEQCETFLTMLQDKENQENIHQVMANKIDQLNEELIKVRADNSSLRRDQLIRMNNEMRMNMSSDAHLSPYEESLKDEDKILTLESSTQTDSDLEKEFNKILKYFLKEGENTQQKHSKPECTSEPKKKPNDEKKQAEEKQEENKIKVGDLINLSTTFDEPLPELELPRKRITRPKITKEKRIKICSTKLFMSWTVTMMAVVILAHIGMAKADIGMENLQLQQNEQPTFYKITTDTMEIMTYLLAGTLAALALILIVTMVIACYINNMTNQRSRTMMGSVIFLLMLAAATAQESASNNENGTIIKQGIVFERHGEAIIGAPLVKFQKKYKPCDLTILKSKFEKLLKQYEELCETEIVEEYENAEIVNKTEGNYVLLAGNMTLPQARHACKSLDSNVISIKTGEQAKKLSRFMHLNDLKYIHAGLEWNEPTSEIIFSDTRAMASDKVFNDVYDKYRGENVSWKRAHDSAVSTPQGIHYTYKRMDNAEVQNGLALIFWRQNLIPGTKQRGIARLERVICEKPTKSVRSLTKIDQWRTQCKQKLENLQVIGLQLDAKIRPILPENQQPRTSTLVPVMTYIEDNPFGALFQQHKIAINNTEKDLKTILLDETISLNEMCTAVVDFLKDKYDFREGPANVKRETDNNTRDKRGVGAIAGLGFVFNLVEFLTKTAFAGVRFNKWRQRNSWNNNAGRGSDVLHLMLKKNDYNEQLDLAVQFVTATTKETRIREEIDIIIEYITEATAKLSTILNDKGYRPSAHEFISEKDYGNIKHMMTQKYKVNIPDSLRNIKASITVDRDAFLVEFVIPINPELYLSDLYQLHGLGRFTEGRRYEPDLHVQYVAISTRGDQIFTKLEKSELIDCKEQEFCTATHPAITKVDTSCGLCSYFQKRKDCCRYITPNNPNQPRFLTLGRKIFYVTDHDKELNLTITCLNEKRNSLQSKEQLILSGVGFFTLDIACQATTNDDEIIVRPSIDMKQTGTILHQQRQKSEPRYQLFKQTTAQADFEFDIKVLTEKRAFEKYIKKTLIVTSIVGAVTMLAVPTLIIYLKLRGGPKIISYLTNLETKEVKKILKVRHIKKAIKAAVWDNSESENGSDQENESKGNQRPFFPLPPPPPLEPLEDLQRHLQQAKYQQQASQLNMTLRRLEKLANMNEYTDVEDGRGTDASRVPSYILPEPQFNSTIQTMPQQRFGDKDAIGGESVEKRRQKLIRQRNGDFDRTTQSLPQ